MTPVLLPFHAHFLPLLTDGPRCPLTGRPNPLESAPLDDMLAAHLRGKQASGVAAPEISNYLADYHSQAAARHDHDEARKNHFAVASNETRAQLVAYLRYRAELVEGALFWQVSVPDTPAVVVPAANENQAIARFSEVTGVTGVAWPLKHGVSCLNPPPEPVAELKLAELPVDHLAATDL